MVFVERENGVIVGVFAMPQPGRAEEQLSDDAAEVVAFREQIAAQIAAIGQP